MSRTATLALLLIGLTLQSAGCNYTTSEADYASLGLVQISGTVTLDGNPLPNAAVYFHNRAERIYSYGVTDANGRYSLRFDSKVMGVMPGPKEVEITTAKNPAAPVTDGPGGSGAEGDEEESNEDSGVVAPAKSAEQVPARYNTKTELKFDVVGSDDAVDFALVSQ